MEQQLKRIQDKLQQLLKSYQLLQKEHEKLTEENRQLKNKLQTGSAQTESLEQKLSVLKIASGNLTEIEKRELEKRMNAYVREIDRCITMLAE
ncbi:MAG: hypothetical protein H7Y31_17915 [Chitinophagaceae bacterium]|nr:hypothetical protein [Chitinophagaceae bacterium]